MDYIGTIRRGWEITWSNKYLWLLGFLAALGSGNSLLNYSTSGGEMQQFNMTPSQMAALAGGAVALACVGLIVGIVIWLLSLAARGGLISAVARIDRGKTPTFGESFRSGWRKVWRLAGMTILLFGVLLILGLGIVFLVLVPSGVMAAFMGGQDASGGALAGLGILALCGLGLLCLLIPIGLALTFIYPFAMRGLVLRNMGVTESIRHGWNVLKSNLGNILLLALAFFILNIIVGLLTVAILLPLAFLVAIPFNVLASANATVLQGLLAVLAGVAVLLIIAAVASVLTAWQSATFTLAYMQFTGKDFDIEAV